MSESVLRRPSRNESQAVALPSPRCGAIAIRQATLHDVPFIDQLQRKHAKMVGWFPTKQIESNISKGQVLIAEQAISPSLAGRGSGGGSDVMCDEAAGEGGESTHPPAPSLKGGGDGRMHPAGSGGCCLKGAGGAKLGYCIFSDKYLKREELGIVYQLNIAPTKQRGLIGATLIKHVFDRAAYGCKLFCCWCAQDLQANYFWESLGFVPLAFRTGLRRSKKRGPRIHIFWQRRIRAGDTRTPY